MIGIGQEINIYDEDTLSALKMAIENGSIDIDALKRDAEEMKRKSALDKHEHKIWQGSDGNWYTFVPDDTKDKKRRKVKKKERDDLIEYLVNFYSDNDTGEYANPNLTFAEAYVLWQKNSKEYENVQPSTIERRECDYKRFIKDTELDKKPLRLTTERDILMFLQNINLEYRNKIGSKAFNNTKSIISGTFAYAKVYLCIDCMLVKELLATYKAPSNSFKKVNQEHQVFMDDEADMIIKEIREKHWEDQRYLALLFMLTTGIRLGEMVALKTTDFLDGNKLHIQRTLTKGRDKNGKYYRKVEDRTKTDSSNNIIYLSEEALIVYNQMMKIRTDNEISCDYLISENGDFVSDCKLDKTLRKLCEDLGIPVRGCHKLRKTYCSYLLELNVPAKVVQNQMRHSCFQTTESHYYYSTKSENAVRNEINKCNRIDRMALSS